MATKKTTPAAERNSAGTAIVEKHRTQMNALTDVQREKLFSKGMQLIYGGGKTHKAKVSSR